MINLPKLCFEASPEAIYINDFVCMVSLRLFNAFVSKESLWFFILTRHQTAAALPEFPYFQKYRTNVLTFYGY